MANEVENHVVEEVKEEGIEAGTWDESGLVNSLDRKGFTHNKCGSELIANSADAGASLVQFVVIGTTTIELRDNGRGMNLEKLKNMCDAFRANNNENKSMGVSGIGGTIAGRIWSKDDTNMPTCVVIYTMTDKSALKAVIPWDEIDKKKIYTGQIKIYMMTEDEIRKFNADRASERNVNGTTIQWKYSVTLYNTILVQFEREKRLKHLDTYERWDMIFGAKDIIITFIDKFKTPITLPKYDYFSLPDTHYYTGINYELIHHYEDTNKKDRYIWEKDENEFLEIRQTDKICKKVPDGISAPSNSWILHGTYIIYNGMQKDTRIFDENNPTRCLESATLFLNEYEQTLFDINSRKEVLRQDLAALTLYRNEQLITGKELEGYNGKTSRGGGDSLMKTFIHRTSIRYFVFSTQDNKMDVTIGIQENKNQHSHNWPKPLERMIAYLKKTNYDNIMKYFEESKMVYLEQKRLEREQIKKEKQKEAEERERKRREEEKMQKEEVDKKNEEQEQAEDKDEDKDEEDSEDDEQSDDDQCNDETKGTFITVVVESDSDSEIAKIYPEEDDENTEDKSSIGNNDTVSVKSEEDAHTELDDEPEKVIEEIQNTKPTKEIIMQMLYDKVNNDQHSDVIQSIFDILNKL